jgi:transcriptional regulator with XRE-family HTH domain
MEMDKIGTKIRVERKKAGLTLEGLAEKVGISAITLQRIETAKSSPSVVLLSEIAHYLNKSIFSFIEETNKPFVHIKRQNQWSMESPALKVKLIGPRKMIMDNIVVTYGELRKGKTIDPHTNPGLEFAYNIEGRCEFKLNGQSYFLEAGDSISFNSRLEHSVTAHEKLKFFGVYVEDKD